MRRLVDAHVRRGIVQSGEAMGDLIKLNASPTPAQLARYQLIQLVQRLPDDQIEDVLAVVEALSAAQAQRGAQRR